MSEEKEQKLNNTEEWLAIFKSGHLKEYIASVIRLNQLKLYKEDEVVGYRDQPSHGGSMVRFDLKAKDVIKQEEKNVVSNAKFLIAIEKVEKLFKENPKLWEQK